MLATLLFRNENASSVVGGGGSDKCDELLLANDNSVVIVGSDTSSSSLSSSSSPNSAKSPVNRNYVIESAVEVVDDVANAADTLTPTVIENDSETSKSHYKCLSSNIEGPQYDRHTQRCLLFNKIVELLPEHMVQPKGNLSDFVLI